MNSGMRGTRQREKQLVKTPQKKSQAHDSSKPAAILPAGYGVFLNTLKKHIREAQIRAGLSVSRELISLYFRIGRHIVGQQQAKGWGNAVVERLAADLRKDFPDIAGFSASNIWRIRSFYLAYAEYDGATAAVRELGADENARQHLKKSAESSKTPHFTGEDRKRRGRMNFAGTLDQDAKKTLAVREIDNDLPAEILNIPWGHHVVLIEKLKDRRQRLWYARQAATQGWSRAMLLHWIESDLYARQGTAITNFKSTLPQPFSDLASEIIKDPYNFDFLTLKTDAAERDLEQGLIDHVRKFLLELGAGFALVGQQVPLQVDGEDYFIDLLFYHLRLRCFVVIDLKIQDFKPEFAGKMNFYLSAVDDTYRHPGDQPTIGLILCKTRKNTIAEYALRDLAKPVGVARYKTKIFEKLPTLLKEALPSPQLIEDELSRAEGNPLVPKKKRRK